MKNKNIRAYLPISTIIGILFLLSPLPLQATAQAEEALRPDQIKQKAEEMVKEAVEKEALIKNKKGDFTVEGIKTTIYNNDPIPLSKKLVIKADLIRRVNFYKYFKMEYYYTLECNLYYIEVERQFFSESERCVLIDKKANTVKNVNLPHPYPELSLSSRKKPDQIVQRTTEEVLETNQIVQRAEEILKEVIRRGILIGSILELTNLRIEDIKTAFYINDSMPSIRKLIIGVDLTAPRRFGVDLTVRRKYRLSCELYYNRSEHQFFRGKNCKLTRLSDNRMKMVNLLPPYPAVSLPLTAPEQLQQKAKDMFKITVEKWAQAQIEEKNDDHSFSNEFTAGAIKTNLFYEGSGIDSEIKGISLEVDLTNEYIGICPSHPELYCDLTREYILRACKLYYNEITDQFFHEGNCLLEDKETGTVEDVKLFEALPFFSSNIPSNNILWKSQQILKIVDPKECCQ